MIHTVFEDDNSVVLFPTDPPKATKFSLKSMVKVGVQLARLWAETSE